jgi:RNA polymerase sigma-70 factor (ECF subfamily)
MQMVKVNPTHDHEELITRCRMGDQHAFKSLYHLYAKAMYNVSYRITGTEEDAKDVLQESFVSAYKNLEYYRGEASFGSWLKRIVINRSINVIRTRRADLVPDDGLINAVEEPAPEAYREELTVEKVRAAIMELPDGYRSVLSLYLLEGYDHQEIAEIMRITESTSKSQLNRAKTRLRELLTKKL